LHHLYLTLPSRGNYYQGEDGYQGSYCYQGEFLHIYKLLPGITLPVLQQHLHKDCLLKFCEGFPFQVAQHPQNCCGFVITVHKTHHVARCVEYDATVAKANRFHLLELALDRVYHKQAQTPTRRICRQLPASISLPVFQKHLSHIEVFSHSLQPYTVTSDPQVPNGFVVTVCLGNHVAINEVVLDAALTAALTAIPSCQACRYWAHMDPHLALAPTTGTHRQEPQEKPTADKATPTAGTKPTPKAESKLWMLSHAVSVCLTQLCQLLQSPKSSRAPDPLPPLAVQDTHLKPHHRLWKQTTATPQVSLPGILSMIVLLSTIMQCDHPMIYHTYRSSPRSLVSNGLRWQLALLAKAMATAWDLITQTHLELWGQL
jgi:hypothetical protein